MTAAATARSGSTLSLTMLLFVVFISLTGFGAVIPLLPFYGVIYGAPAWQVTLLFAVFSFGQFVGELVWGGLSDRVGRRPVLFATMMLSALAFVAFAYAPTIWPAILARGISGFFSGNMSAVQGFIADESPKERLRGRLALVSAIFGVGFVVGPILGGVLAHPEDGAAGIRLPVLAAAGLYFAAAMGALLFLRETRQRRPDHAGATSHLMALLGAVTDPVVRNLLAITFLSFAAYSSVTPTLGFWAQAKLGWEPRDMGVALGISAGVGAVFQVVFSRFGARRFGEAATICGSLTLAAVALMVLGFSIDAVMATTVLTIALTGHMISQPANSAMVSRLSPPHQQGSALGANMAISALARVVGPVGAGIVISTLGPQAAFIAAGLTMLPAIWLGWRMGMDRRRDRRLPGAASG